MDEVVKDTMIHWQNLKLLIIKLNVRNICKFLFCWTLLLRNVLYVFVGKIKLAAASHVLCPLHEAIHLDCEQKIGTKYWDVLGIIERLKFNVKSNFYCAAFEQCRCYALYKDINYKEHTACISEKYLRQNIKT